MSIANGAKYREAIAKSTTKILAKFQVGGADECWPWHGSINEDGYGTFYFENKTGGLNCIAHRLVWLIVVGELSDATVLDHKCRTRWCVNPNHLKPKSTGANVLCGEGITAMNLKKEACPKGHPYSGDNLYIDPRGHRVCRECKRIWGAEHYVSRKG